MTIKTLKTTSSCSINVKSNAISSDMPSFKRTGAVKNLFNTTVDREELQQQLKSVDRIGMRELGKYKCESKILEIRRDDDHQARRLKYQPAKETDTKRCHSTKSTSQSTLHSMIFNRDDSSSSSSFKSSSLPSTSKMLSVQKTATSTNPALPKGQRTIKDYYQSVKRSRQNR
ncbi:unnamed protein product [Chironomus riparius]|uniref:Uncharacterized protein n=1 Tax=Chironomus riparius TaxID=315576 RepID=A0A9N9S7U6_9DIPT|nr:unnamed protein product [Chironomus riparius]